MSDFLCTTYDDICQKYHQPAADWNLEKPESSEGTMLQESDRQIGTNNNNS